MPDDTDTDSGEETEEKPGETPEDVLRMPTENLPEE